MSLTNESYGRYVSNEAHASDELLISSLVRSSELRRRLRAAWLSGRWLERLDRPRAGDVVAVACLADHGAYQTLEVGPGDERPLNEGRIFLGVLGDRFSGTNVYAALPARALDKGDVLQLASVGGVLGDVVDVAGYYRAPALPVRIIGFPMDGEAHKAASISEWPTIQRQRAQGAGHGRVLLVCGTSAETGKTSTVARLLDWACRNMPEHRGCAVKICGTGRMRDCVRYLESGALKALDFVDLGHPTTYGLSEAQSAYILERLTGEAEQSSDFVLAELGGDLLEAGAPTMIAAGVKRSRGVILCVNDAMGAIDGLRRLSEAGAECVWVVSLRQNAHALSKRLEGIPVFDGFKDTEMDRLAKDVFVALTLAGMNETADA